MPKRNNQQVPQAQVPQALPQTRVSLGEGKNIDFASLAKKLLADSLSLLPEWLPEGRLEGLEYVALNPLRADKDLGSFKINCQTGQWADFATDDKGGDLISLYAYLKGLSQSQAAMALSGGDQEPYEDHGENPFEGDFKTEDSKTSDKDRTRENPTPLVPVPSGAPLCDFNTGQDGANTGQDGASHKVYSYYQWDPIKESSHLVGHVTRHNLVDPEGGRDKKIFLPWSFCEFPDGFRRWVSKAIPAPRPLYQLPLLFQRPEAAVLVCEGEKTAQGAQKLFPHMVCVTSMGGSLAACKTDWSPVKSRCVIIAPDCDAAGKRYADTVYDLCLKQGAQDILYLATDKLALLAPSDLSSWDHENTGKEKTVPHSVPPGYDLADSVAEGWTPSLLIKEFGESLEGLISPYIRIFTKEERLGEINQGIDPLFAIKPDGVYYKKFSKSATEEDEGSQNRYIEQKLCSYLAPTHQIRSPDGTHDWGRLFELEDNDGTLLSHLILMEDMGGDGNTYRSALLSRGLQPYIGWSNKLLHLFIATSKPLHRAKIVKKPGWHGTSFVLPHITYGTAEEKHLLHCEGEQFTTNGTLKGWQKHIGRLCEENPHLLLSICLPLVGPLLSLTGDENFCIHFVSSSSTGKSTALEVAASIFGQRLSSWRTTDNAAESLAKKANDTLLLLDEISQGNAKSVDAMAYMLGNGVTKGRANRLGEAKPVDSFRTVILSSGETGLGEKLQETGRRGKAGQTVRLIEIDADAGQGFGIFTCLHGVQNGSLLSQELKRTSKFYRGTVGDLYLKSLCIQDLEDLKVRIEKARKEWIDLFVPLGSDGQVHGQVHGQVQRVGSKFALIAAAGELAIALGIYLYPQGTIEQAMATLYKNWIKNRGGVQAYELTQVEERLKALIAQQGASRFENPWEHSSSSIHNRAGFRKINEKGQWEYYVFPNVFKSEVVSTLTERQAKKHLARRGFLIRNDQGEYTTSLHVPNHGQTRLYKISSQIVNEGEAEGEEA